MKSLRATAWTALLLAVAFSGCISSDEPPAEEPVLPPAPGVGTDWARQAVFGPDFLDFGVGDPVAHDHSDRSLHRFQTDNFRLVGWDPLTTQRHGASAGGYYCGEVSSEGDRRLAVVNSFTSTVAMVVMDVTDPAAPEFLGELVLENTQVYDSAITADGSFAVLATSPLATITHEDQQTPPGLDLDVPEVHAVRASWTDACGQTFQGPLDVVPFDSGVALVDLRDPTVPAVADFVPQPALGPHSVSATRIDGTDYVLASTTNLVYSGSFFSFFTVDVLPGDVAKLTPYGEVSAHYACEDCETPDDPLDVLNLLNGHVDGTLYKHPVTGEVIAHLANWDAGLLTVRLDGPGQITQLGTWGAFDPSRGTSATGAIHSAYPLPEARDGRHYTITGQEVGGSINTTTDKRPTGQMVLLDTTDPAAPEPVARWTIPVDFVWSGDLHFSTHYATMQGDTLFVATYHGGLWAADASPEHWPDLPTTGVFLPSNDPPGGAVTDTAYAPYVLEVLDLDGEHLLVYDGTSGAYTVAFDEDMEIQAAPALEQTFIG